MQTTFSISILAYLDISNIHILGTKPRGPGKISAQQKMIGHVLLCKWIYLYFLNLFFFFWRREGNIFFCFLLLNLILIFGCSWRDFLSTTLAPSSTISPWQTYVFFYTHFHLSWVTDLSGLQLHNRDLISPIISSPNANTWIPP